MLIGGTAPAAVHRPPAIRTLPWRRCGRQKGEGEGQPLEADDDLLRKCQAGDEDALAQLVRRYEARVFRLACRVTGDAAQAEEAVVEAFARVWAKARQWRGEARAGTWIYQVALRTTLDQRRSRRRWWRRWGASVPAEVPDPRPAPDEGVAAADDR